MTVIKPIPPLDGYRIIPLFHIAIRIDRLKIQITFFFREFCCFLLFFSSSISCFRLVPLGAPDVFDLCR